jgi:hypothetical protein
MVVNALGLKGTMLHSCPVKVEGIAGDLVV